MTSPVRASMLVIGDEILDGHTQDTNSGWLAGRLSDVGVPLDRIVTVPDDIDAIGEALHTELTRGGPRMVLSSGGIGSTPDDLTIEAVAAYLGVGLESHPELDAHISGWTDRAASEGIAVPPEHQRAMRKMTLVPAGSYLVGNARGVMPSVAIDIDGGLGAGGSVIVILPGVPSEFRRLVEAGVLGLLDGLGEPKHLVEIRHPYPESALSPLLDELVAAFPAVGVGSYPARECLIRLKGPKQQVEEAAARVRAALARMAGSEDAQRMSARWQAHWS